MLDRWCVSGTMPQGVTKLTMSNYMSIGVDAKAAVLWAMMARRVMRNLLCSWCVRLLYLSSLWRA